MLRRSLILVVFALIAANTLALLWPISATARSTPYLDDASVNMAQAVQQLDLKDAPFRDAVNRLAETAHIGIVLEDKDIPDRTRITLSIRGQRFDAVLQQILRQEPDYGPTLRYHTRSCVVIVRSERVPEGQWSTRVYDMRELILAQARLNRMLAGEDQQAEMTPHEHRIASGDLIECINDLLHSANSDDEMYNLHELCGRFIITAPSGIHDLIRQRMPQWREQIQSGHLPFNPPVSFQRYRGTRAELF